MAKSKKKKNLKKSAQTSSKSKNKNKKGSSRSNSSKKEKREFLVKKIKKRDGSVVDFDLNKIVTAILKAMTATGEGDEEDARVVANKVYADLVRISKTYDEFIPTVEGIQDTVEKELILSSYPSTAKAYILYRQERAKMRSKRPVPKEVKEKVEESSKYFASPYSEFIFYRTYSRWMPDKGRRETWEEAVDRFMDFMEEEMGDRLSKREYTQVRKGILNQEVCPSMRLLWSAGDAAKSSNVWAYNCSYVAPTRPQDLGEIMYISMCGAGLGFTVESENVQQFPQIKKQTGKKRDTYVIPDSKEGWADAFVYGMKTWFEGEDVEFDYSQIRPAGARLETAGGRASGPQPLKDLMEFTKKKMLAKQGKRLSNIDLHDIICKIGYIVVAGGVRRSSLISLSELDDIEMRDAKKGQFYTSQPQRSMANNSAIYDNKPSAEEFLDEWTALVKSKSGERGIFNRGDLEKQVPKRRWKAIKNEKQMGMNPCGEIYLRSKQFCNLTSIVVRPDDDLKSLRRKMKLATILGTYQATLTHFPYLSKEWKENCEEERLLGVSLTGYYDNDLIRDNDTLDNLREYAIKVNKKYSKKFNINQSTAITCVKPHGNSGQLLNTASGMHPRFAKYFVRRVRISANDPLLQLAKDQGVPCYPETGQTEGNATTYVLEFPVKSPDGARVKDDVGATELLKEWKRLKEHFVEHNPSATIYVGDDEWLEVANFVYENWESVGGLSFLPRSDHVYELAPYEEIDKKEYKKRIKEIKDLDFSKLLQYEAEDNTEGSKEFACVGGVCELSDLDALEIAKKRKS